MNIYILWRGGGAPTLGIILGAWLDFGKADAAMRADAATQGTVLTNGRWDLTSALLSFGIPDAGGTYSKLYTVLRLTVQN